MAHKTMSADQHNAILREAREVEQVVAMPGWKILDQAIKDQMEAIKNQLAENRLRTIHETMTTKDGSQTFITSAETQIAENAGMYKMGKWVFNLVETIVKAPSQVESLRQQGVLTVEEKQSETKPKAKGGETT